MAVRCCPVAYNFPAGGGLQLDREYAYQDEGASPFGGETIPMNNTMLPGALLEQEMEALGRDAHFSTTVTYRIDPCTGVVQHMEHVATKRFGGKEEIETSVLWLREP